MNLFCCAHLLRERNDFGCCRRIPLDVSHLACTDDEGFEPSVEIKFVLTRAQFPSFNGHPRVMRKGQESLSQVIDLVPKLVRYLGRYGKLIGLRHGRLSRNDIHLPFDGTVKAFLTDILTLGPPTRIALAWWPYLATRNPF